jgi:signal transduction histidine kinase/ligand-binding sensor domain-containing protein
MRLSLLMLLAFLGLPAPAASQEVPLALYQRKTLHPELGAPASALGMTQAADGTLWFTGTSGLYRSDGAGFERVEIEGLRSTVAHEAPFIHADPSDGIWLHGNGTGIVVVRSNTLTEYDDTHGLPKAKQIRDIAFLKKKALAATMGGLYELRGSRWFQSVPVEWMRDKPIEELIVDGKENIWFVSSGEAHMVSPTGRHVVIPLPGPIDLTQGLIAGPGGSIWYWRNAGTEDNLCLLREGTPADCWDVPRIETPKFAPDGALWWNGRGSVWRLPDAALLNPKNPGEVEEKAEHIEVPAGNVVALKDGSVWVMGPDGVSRLKRPAVVPVNSPSGGLAPAATGGVWVVSYMRGLMRVAPPADGDQILEQEDGTRWLSKQLPRGSTGRLVVGKMGDNVVVEHHEMFSGFRLMPQSDGDLYVSVLTPPSLQILKNEHIEPVALPELDQGSSVRGVARDKAGTLWIAVGANKIPLYQKVDGSWRPVPIQGINEVGPIGGFVIDDNDTFWLATRDHGVIAIQGGKPTLHTTGSGRKMGRVFDVFPLGGRIWATSGEGVFAFQNGRFIRLRSIEENALTGVTGIIQRENGDLWLAGVNGIFRIAKAEWEAALVDPDHVVRYFNVGRPEGMTSQAARGPFPSAAQANDGALWFAMQTGLFRLDPTAFQEVDAAPAVHITKVIVAGEPRSASKLVELAPDEQRISLTFLAPGAQVPERTRFRYRLSQDRQTGEWMDIGATRHLDLERLRHGSYELELAASDREGRWSSETTKISFRVAPRFYQATWFYVLMALIALLALSLLFMWRSRQITERIRAEMSARISERERIARELHDTLLQSTQGLLLSFHGLASRLKPEDPIRSRMEALLERTQDVIREGRDHVHMLRDPDSGTRDLGECLQKHAQELAEERSVLCEVVLPQDPPALQPTTYEHLRQIGREALNNAFAHASACRVQLVLDCTDKGVRLRIFDDGIGISHDVADPERHWGIRGMHERAAAIGASLTVGSGLDGRGTGVDVFVPSSKAYLH